MRKLKIIGGIMLLSIALVGCGPKKATKETLSQLEECRKANQAAMQKIEQLKAEIEGIKKSNLDQRLKELEHKRDSLKQYLELLKKGY